MQTFESPSCDRALTTAVHVCFPCQANYSVAQVFHFVRHITISVRPLVGLLCYLFLDLFGSLSHTNLFHSNYFWQAHLIQVLFNTPLASGRVELLKHDHVRLLESRSYTIDLLAKVPFCFFSQTSNNKLELLALFHRIVLFCFQPIVYVFEVGLIERARKLELFIFETSRDFVRQTSLIYQAAVNLSSATGICSRTAWAGTLLLVEINVSPIAVLPIRVNMIN